MTHTSIHPTAVVEPGADIGQQVSIGPFAYIAAGCRVGDETTIGPHAVLYGHARIGKRCRIHAGAVMADVPQDMGFEGGDSGVEIGDDCLIREGVTIHRGTKEGAVTRVGNGCMLMAFSHLGHNVTLGDCVILANGVLLAGHVDVGEGAFISGNAVVHQFTRIGRLAMLSGLSGIGMDVPPFCNAAGVKRNEVAGLNIVGMKRAGLKPEERKQIKHAYKLLYQSGLAPKEAAERIRTECAEGPAHEIADFIDASKRGICPAGRTQD